MWLRLLGAKIGKDVEASTALMLPSLVTVNEGAFLADADALSRIPVDDVRPLDAIQGATLFLPGIELKSVVFQPAFRVLQFTKPSNGTLAIFERIGDVGEVCARFSGVGITAHDIGVVDATRNLTITYKEKESQVFDFSKNGIMRLFTGPEGCR